jgi:hypothetical protein
MARSAGTATCPTRTISGPTVRWARTGRSAPTGRWARAASNRGEIGRRFRRGPFVLGQSIANDVDRQPKGTPAMLGRKNYTQEELDHAKAAIDQQLAAYKKLVKAIDGATSDPKVAAALEAFEPLFFNNMTIVLDRYFVHRIRVVTGKDGNPLNEVELMSDSLMNNDGVLRANNVIKLIPDESVVKLEIGDPIRLTAAQFARLSKAFFAEIESKFV